jgi:hypothetical protein
VAWAPSSRNFGDGYGAALVVVGGVEVELAVVLAVCLDDVGPHASRPAVALKEIGIRPDWRKTGTARRVHGSPLATRDEPYVTLVVTPAAGDGKVHALYKSWGYEDVGQSQPSPASPVLTVMIRTIR